MKPTSTLLDLLSRLRAGNRPGPTGPGPLSSGDTSFVPPPLPEQANDAEDFAGWGFADTRFRVNTRGNVELTGSRYNICGIDMPHLLPWMAGTVSSPITPNDVLESHWPPKVPAPIRNEALLVELRTFLQPNQITEEDVVRLRHGHGHTQEEIYAVNYGTVGRVPDVVVYPRSTEEVEKLVTAAGRHGATLLPFGGGTNVTDALRCPESETRTIVSVDMRKLNRVLWVDPVNRQACIQAGMAGRHIAESLARYGMMMGHEPDSVEFSTLGGWIATHASGMKKNRYGNIEDIVQDMEVVTARGTMTRNNTGPRESIGVDPRRIVFGSEGSLGIITSAVVKLFPMPAVSRFASMLFKDLHSGFNFLHDITRSGMAPASLRLMDNTQFHFGQALKPDSSGLAAAKSALEAKVVALKGYDVHKLTVATLVYEGTEAEVRAQELAAAESAARHGGMAAGSANGERGYQLTFGIAYIRDLIFRHHMVAESFETSVPWSHAEHLFERVKARAREEHVKMGLPGTPFITGRVTQVYETGVCCYFYLGFYAKGMQNPTAVYLELEERVREEILACGGSLSHHHGIGKLRKRFLSDIHSPASLDLLRQTKNAFDPDNVFGAGNQAFGEQR